MATSIPEDIIFQTKSFTVEKAPRPFVSIEEGGHIRIFPKNKNITCINDLTPNGAIELIQLEMIVRESLIEGMNNRGIPVTWVNLEDLGNWAFKRNETPQLHIHVFGRAANATKQKWPEAVYLPDWKSGFYDDFEPLSKEDMEEIKKSIEKRYKLEKYSCKNWCIKN
jgi:diadenosine tetraphosphate (Ap4A) HIT family hydrolase